MERIVGNPEVGQKRVSANLAGLVKVALRRVTMGASEIFSDLGGENDSGLPMIRSSDRMDIRI